MNEQPDVLQWRDADAPVGKGVPAVSDGGALPAPKRSEPAPIRTVIINAKSSIARPDWSVPAESIAVAVTDHSAELDHETGLPVSVIQDLQREPDGLEAGLSDLRGKIVQRWGDDAAQVAEWAGELSPSTLAQVVSVFRHNWHRPDADLLKLISGKLTLAQSAEFKAWLSKE